MARTMSDSNNKVARVTRRVAMAMLVSSSILAHASTWLESSQMTFDTAVRSGTSVVKRGQLLARGYQQAPVIVDLGIPANVQISALTLNGADTLYTPDISFSLGGTVVTPRDVVLRNGGGTSIYLHGSDLGLKATVKLDALAMAGADVLFSVDTATSTNGINVLPGDVLRWNGATVSISLSAQALGLSSGTNLVLLESLPNENLLMGFDVSGLLGGVAFKAGEILEYEPATNHWALFRDRTRFGVSCNPCNPKAIAVTANPDVLFRSGMESYED